jgi:hypothetical protein
MKLVSITKSPKADKKLMATFEDNGRTTHRHFGQKGASDFTQNKDPARKALYIARHEARENWNDAKSAGALSKWVLWNKTSLTASIADYKRHFGL